MGSQMVNFESEIEANLRLKKVSCGGQKQTFQYAKGVPWHHTTLLVSGSDLILALGETLSRGKGVSCSELVQDRTSSLQGGKQIRVAARSSLYSYDPHYQQLQTGIRLQGLTFPPTFFRTTKSRLEIISRGGFKRYRNSYMHFMCFLLL